jgi:hypothetical protein
MPSVSLSPAPKLQFFGTDGNPLVGGKVYTYAAGTTTPLATYVDSAGVTTNTNPIILDTRGEANIWLPSASYKLVLRTATDTLIWTVDNITSNEALKVYMLAQLAAFAADLANTTDIAKGDALIGFKQSSISAVYTGAVGKTVHDKLTEFVSIWDFIPKAEWAALQAGTSTYDCLSAFTNAINTGKSLDIRNGTFPISSTLSPKSNTTWSGDTSGVLKWTTVNCIIYANQITGWTMDGIVVDGNYTGYIISGVQKAWGIQLEECVQINIRNSVFRYLYRIGICVGQASAVMCQDIVIDNNVIHDCGYPADPSVGYGNGVAVLSASNVKITNNWVYNITGNTSGTAGINLEPSLEAYNCYDIEIASNKVTDCNNCPGIQLYMGHPSDYTGVRRNINIHDNIVSNTGTGQGIACTQFGDTFIRNNQLDSTQGILVKRYKAAKAIVEGNVISSVTTSGGYGIQFQDGIASAIVRGNRLKSISGVGIQVDMFDYTVAMAAKECLIQDNVINASTGAAITYSAGNFVISGNMMVNCSSITDYYMKSLLGGAYQSINGFIGSNTFVSTSGSILAFINTEGNLQDNVQIGTNSYVGPITPTMKTYTYNIDGRVPGIITDTLPASGTWKVGDIIWKATPAASGYIGWVCTTAGTPGTFKQFGTIQA